MILLIDNFDSFVFNLSRYLRLLGQETLVVRNNAIRADRAVSVSGALDRVEGARGNDLAAALAQLEEAAMALEVDSRASRVGDARGTDRGRMRSLSATLRGVASSMR